VDGRQERGDPQELASFIETMGEDRKFAFLMLDRARLVELHNYVCTWPKPDHPAAAAYMATIVGPVAL